MGLADRFELLELLRGDSIQTFRARERATGRWLEAHVFVVPEAPSSAALLARLDHLDQPRRGRIVDRGSHEGKPYVITDPLTGYAGFREWLTAEPAAGAPGPESKPLDAAGAWRIARPAEPPSPPAPEPVLPSVAPGDFTRMFQLRQAPEPSPVPPAIKPAEPPAPATPQPGAFTRVFQRPASVSSVPAAADASGSGQPGEFTRMFQTPSSQATPPAAQAQPPEGTVSPASPVPSPGQDVPQPAAEPSQPVGTSSEEPTRFPAIIVVAGIVGLAAIAVFFLVRML